MKQRLLSAIYPLVKDFNDAPLSIALLSTGFQMSESEVKTGFTELIEEGLVEKKYETLHIYRLTKEGLELAREVFEEKQNASI